MKQHPRSIEHLQENSFRSGKGLRAGLGLISVFLIAAALTATPKDPRLQAVKSFAFALGDGMLDGDVAARFAGYDLVVVDGEDVQAGQVAALHAQGTIVLAYLSVGTIERYRWWYSSVRRFRLDYWGDWGEWYADVSKSGFRDVIAGKVAPWMLKKGVDGLFLDNTDMIETHPGQRLGMKALVKRLANLVHLKKKFLFTQNGAGVIGPMLAFYDGWNREDVSWSYDFGTGRYFQQSAGDIAAALAEIQTIGAAGLLVTTADYTEAGNTAAESLCLANACSVGAVPFVSDIELTRMPAAPLTCGTEPASLRPDASSSRRIAP